MKKIIFFSVLLFLSCGSDEQEGKTLSDWLIPAGEVFDGGPGKDGIPSIDNPNFDDGSDVNFLNDEELVIGIIRNGKAKAYPHSILDWHEIVNDEISDIEYGLTYCPLTGTGVAWDRNINGETTTFGVSGKLYNTNLIPYDRETDSYWSQMRLDCVKGELAGSQISTFSVIETSWATWKAAYPNTTVLNTDTGFDRNYNEYPYGDYRTNDNNILFPLSNDDDRLPAKERVLGLVESDTKRVYSIELFETGRVIEDQLDGKDIIVVGSKADNFIVVFENQDLTDVTFVSGQLPIIAEDTNGNKLTLSGQIVIGPLKGSELEPQSAFMGYFFAFGTFYKDIEIFE